VHHIDTAALGTGGSPVTADLPDGAVAGDLAACDLAPGGRDMAPPALEDPGAGPRRTRPNCVPEWVSAGGHGEWCRCHAHRPRCPRDAVGHRPTPRRRGQYGRLQGGATGCRDLQTRPAPTDLSRGGTVRGG
jgi:hypothetical protein